MNRHQKESLKQKLYGASVLVLTLITMSIQI